MPIKGLWEYAERSIRRRMILAGNPNPVFESGCRHGAVPIVESPVILGCHKTNIWQRIDQAGGVWNSQEMPVAVCPLQCVTSIRRSMG